MSKALQWVIGIGVIVVAVAVVFTALWPLFAPRAAWAGHGGMGSGHMLGGGGMMGGWGMPFLGLGMLIWPLAAIGLTVIGAAWLARRLGNPGAPETRPAGLSLACVHCGQPLQANWKACPNCGEKVEASQ